MSQIRRLIICKGKKTRQNGKWITESYTLEFDIKSELNKAELNKIRKKALALLDKWLGVKEIIVIEGPSKWKPTESEAKP